MPTSASRLPPTSRSTSVIRAVPGSAAQTRTPTACWSGSLREEPTSRASLRVITLPAAPIALACRRSPDARVGERSRRCPPGSMASDSRPGSRERRELQAWLTTVVGRVCLNMLRSRRSRPEELSVHVPDPVVSFEEDDDPEHEALLAESVGLACSRCSTRSVPPSGSRSCCTTFSGCRSRTSRPLWTAPSRRPAARQPRAAARPGRA